MPNLEQICKAMEKLEHMYITSNQIYSCRNYSIRIPVMGFNVKDNSLIVVFRKKDIEKDYTPALKALQMLHCLDRTKTIKIYYYEVGELVPMYLLKNSRLKDYMHDLEFPVEKNLDAIVDFLQVYKNGY